MRRSPGWCRTRGRPNPPHPGVPAADNGPGGNRTHTSFYRLRILSPLRLPFRHGASCEIDFMAAEPDADGRGEQSRWAITAEVGGWGCGQVASCCWSGTYHS
jgi:hypothetical protein